MTSITGQKKTSLLLAGDIGGTKTLLNLHACTGDALVPLASERFPSTDWADLAAMVRHFLQRNAAAHPGPPDAACFAVAGPVQAGKARLTNLSWNLCATELAAACGIGRVELVNDFAVLVHGLPHLHSHQRALIRAGTAEADEPALILGAGTGLGVTIGIPWGNGGGLRAVPSEAAHAEFAPRTTQEWELKQWLRRDLAIERVSIERVVSGTGLGHVARWLLACRESGDCHPLAAVAERWQGLEAGADNADPVDLPAEVAAAAARGDALATEALQLWLSAYGSVVGDLALACLSRGGIWLAGGTAGKLLDSLRASVFQQAFLSKGRLRPVLETMPIQALIDPEIGSFSAAWRARELLA
ncbi:MAG: glucokinase [Cyanobium sp.]